MDALLPISPWIFSLAFAITTLAGLLQGTLGFGFAIATVPLLSLLDPRLAPVPQLLLAIPLTMWMAWRERHAIALRGVLWILVGRFPGAALGVLLLTLADPKILDLCIAGIVLFAVVVLATSGSIPRIPATQFGAGLVSGAMAVVSSIGGPPIALLYRDAKGEEIRANLAAVFSLGILITLASRILAGKIVQSDVHFALLLLPGSTLGLWWSRRYLGKVEGRPLRIGILVIASVAAVGLFFRALRS